MGFNPAEISEKLEQKTPFFAVNGLKIINYPVNSLFLGKSELPQKSN
ncbi:MAG: hypothetical protein RIB49_13475 [Rhodospirillales bacterium]